MNADEIVTQILAACPVVSRNQVLKRLDKERTRSGGLISDETLLRMIAAEFGCEIPNADVFVGSLSLKDLVSGLNDVTIVGRVVAVFPAKTFGNGQRSGKFASVLLADQSGIFRVILWNDKADLLETDKIKNDHVVRFIHCYTRQDRNGKIELHGGEKCEVEPNPSDIQADDFPTVEKFATKIGDLAQIGPNSQINVIGFVRELYPASTFERQDSSTGKLARFLLADDTGELVVAVWNEKVDEIKESVQKDATVQIVNGKLRKSSGKKMELHVDSGTFVGTFSSGFKKMKIADVCDGLSNVEIDGEVASKPIVREIKTSKGELVKLASFELKDETGCIWVSAWRKHADVAAGFSAGDHVAIRNAYVKKGFGEQLEISTRNATVITANSIRRNDQK